MSRRRIRLLIRVEYTIDRARTSHRGPLFVRVFPRRRGGRVASATARRSTEPPVSAPLREPLADGTRTRPPPHQIFHPLRRERLGDEEKRRRDRRPDIADAQRRSTAHLSPPATRVNRAWNGASDPSETRSNCRSSLRGTAPSSAPPPERNTTSASGRSAATAPKISTNVSAGNGAPPLRRADASRTNASRAAFGSSSNRRAWRVHARRCDIDAPIAAPSRLLRLDLGVAGEFVDARAPAPGPSLAFSRKRPSAGFSLSTASLVTTIFFLVESEEGSRGLVAPTRASRRRLRGRDGGEAAGESRRGFLERLYAGREIDPPPAPTRGARRARARPGRPGAPP